MLRNPENINLVAPSVMEDLGLKAEPCHGTVTISGKIVDIIGQGILEWVFEQPDGEKLPTIRKTRFYVPDIPDPPFDATFSQSTARKYGLL